LQALKTLTERGFVQQVTHTEELDARLQEGPITYYVGFDPTADSMHVGHLLPVMAMAWMQRAGHKPIAVVGGGTAMVGDPSGKTEMRQMLTHEAIANNVAALKGQLSHFLTFGEGEGRLVDNAEWLMKLNYIEFLRDDGRHFSVNRMLAAEAYKQRLERGLSFIEFNYQLLQAFDFLELNSRYGCELQMGGDDQWGNILAGTDLVRRKNSTVAYGLTQPLILTSTGQKMGKTVGGAVWLDPNKLKPFDYYQYWLNIPDADVARMLKLYTFLPMEQIAELEKLTGKDVRKAKAVLAKTTTAQVHGEEEAARAERGAAAMVSGSAAADMPSHTISEDVSLVVALVAAGLTKSNGEGRRLVKGGGVKIDGEKVSDPDFVLTVAAVGEGLVVRLGKKRGLRILVG
jgi:tyrosyl-tRNA synthetase